MGWSGGTDICIKVWDSVRKHIPKGKRAEILAEVMTALSDADWDCCEEVEDEWPEAKDALLLAGLAIEEDE